jgi:hypothetical protein
VEVARAPRGERVEYSEFKSPSIAINGTGEYVVAWHLHVGRGSRPAQASLTDTTTTTIHARRFAFDGRPLGAEQVVAQRRLLLPGGITDLLLPNTRIAMNDDGDYAIGYVEVRLTQQLLSSFKARLYRADGSAAGLPSHFALFGDRGPFINIHDYALSFAANGDLLFAWATRDRYDGPQVNPTTEDIWLARYRRVLGTLLPAGPAAKVATRAAYTPSTTSLNVSPTPSGGSVITWPDPQFNSATRGTAWGRYYDARELPLSEPFLIGSGTNSVHSTTDSRGNLLAAWDGVFVRKFQGP